jgi:hypothetical protein
MCQQYYAQYQWCHCEEHAGHTLCGEGKREDCPGVNVEVMRMQCFCRTHATTSWMTESKSKKKNKKNRSSGSSRSSQNTPIPTEKAKPRTWHRLLRRR